MAYVTVALAPSAERFGLKDSRTAADSTDDVLFREAMLLQILQADLKENGFYLMPFSIGTSET